MGVTNLEKPFRIQVKWRFLHHFAKFGPLGGLTELRKPGGGGQAYIGLRFFGTPIKSVKIKVVLDPDDHTNYYAHSPGGHFVYRHFSPGGPQNFVGLILAQN